MRCEERQRQVSRLIDGEAPYEGSGELFSHLGECRECRTFFRVTMDANRILKRISSESPRTIGPLTFRVRQKTSFALGSLPAPRLSTVALWIVIGLFVATLFSTSISRIDTSQRSELGIPSDATSPLR